MVFTLAQELRIMRFCTLNMFWYRTFASNSSTLRLTHMEKMEHHRPHSRSSIRRSRCLVDSVRWFLRKKVMDVCVKQGGIVNKHLGSTAALLCSALLCSALLVWHSGHPISMDPGLLVLFFGLGWALGLQVSSLT